MLAIGLALTACSKAPIPAQGPARDSEERKIAVAVVRKLLQWHPWGERVGYICLGIRDADPSDELLAMLSDVRPPVVARTRCDAAGAIRSELKERSSGKPAALFQVNTIRWVDGTTVEARAGYHEASLSAAGFKYRLLRNADGEWRVSENAMEFIADGNSLMFPMEERPPNEALNSTKIAPLPDRVAAFAV